MKSDAVSTVSPSILHEVMGPDAMILVFWILCFKPTFSLSSFTFIKRLSRNTWSNRQIWPWSTEWSRAKAHRVLPRERNDHRKHCLPTKQEKTLHMDITRWSTLKSDWIYSLQPKCIQDLNVRPETIELLEDNIGRILDNINQSKILYDSPLGIGNKNKNK